MGRLAVPEMRYARSGDVHIAYQTWDEGRVTITSATDSGGTCSTTTTTLRSERSSVTAGGS